MLKGENEWSNDCWKQIYLDISTYIVDGYMRWLMGKWMQMINSAKVKNIVKT